MGNIWIGPWAIFPQYVDPTFYREVLIWIFNPNPEHEFEFEYYMINSAMIVLSRNDHGVFAALCQTNDQDTSTEYYMKYQRFIIILLLTW